MGLYSGFFQLIAGWRNLSAQPFYPIEVTRQLWNLRISDWNLLSQEENWTQIYMSVAETLSTPKMKDCSVKVAESQRAYKSPLNFALNY